MTLRIRELVIRAEIGGDSDRVESGRDRWSPPEQPSLSDTGTLTRRFYEDGQVKENER